MSEGESMQLSAGARGLVSAEGPARLAVVAQPAAWADGRRRGSGHFAFLVGETEFDAIFGRIRDRGLPYWADPFHRQPGQVNRHDGGRGVYFDDRDGHRLEIITRPYGAGADA